MTDDVSTQDWPGGWRGGPRGRRSGAPQWFSARQGRRGRPPFADVDDPLGLRRVWRSGAFGGPGWGGPHHHGRGRARRGDVRLALLRLLAEEPRNGYQLMQAIEERSEGQWRPSPGSVYPTLTQLEDEGLVRSIATDGGRKFELTDAGRDQVQQRADEPAPWVFPPDGADHPVAELAPLVIQIGKAAFQVASVGDEAQWERARTLLADTRRGLYRILAEEADSSDEAPTEV